MSLDDLRYWTLDRTALNRGAQLQGGRHDSEDRKKRSGLDRDP